MSYLENFTKWQLYAHYVLLTLGLFLWHSLPYTTPIEISGDYVKMFLYYLLALFVLDSIVHAIFYFIPKPYQWRD